ncbi:hypothetical protein GCM10010433_52040 [Streptomyces pulveraceus]|uniref:CHAT domain-containing protein n=1 Tax=Streptomyces pulveraceus TaxID=68258 RepID=A0ABW1GWE7_9ACTN
MSDQESGGVQGLRTWSAEAAERVRGLIPAMGARAVPPGAYDRSVDELGQLVRLLDHDPVLRGAVSVWLGGALALRLSAGAGNGADRERAERLLRDARDRRTALGATVGAEERRWAALFLLTLLTPMRSQPGAPGGVPDLAAFVDRLTRSGPDGVMTFATEIHELTDDIAELPLPPEFLAEYRRMRELFPAGTGADFTQMLANVMPAGDPFAETLRQTVGRMFGGDGGPGAEGPETAAADGAGDERDAGAAPADEGGAAPAAAPALAPEHGPPLALGDIRRIAAALDAVNATTHGFDDALRNGDPRALNELLRKLRSVQDEPPPGPDPTPGIEALKALLLNVSAGVGGTIQDQSAGRAHLDAITRYFGNYDGPLPPGFRDPAVLGRALELYAKVLDAGDAKALRGLADDAEELARTVPEGHPLRFVVELTLGAALTRLGGVIGDLEPIRRGTPFLERGMAGARATDFPFAKATPLPTGPDFALLRAALAGRTAPRVAHVPPPPDASTDEIYSAALSAGLRYSLTRDPAVLDTLIGELERVRDAVREGKAPRIAAEALWQLAEAYRERGVRDQDVQDVRALGAAEEALTVLAADVLLQAGAEHGLLTARSGANRGVQAALWAASQGRLHEAVAVLELGRALVLHAASTSSAVPELLDADGHHELADAWREAVAPGADGAPDDGREQAVPSELPSTLRRRALEALGYRERGGLLGTPTPADLADGVAASGADALVYLVPGEDAEAGVAIIVAPERGVAMKVLPLLSGAGNGPMGRYLDATALRDAAAPDDTAAAQGWEESLGALCDWAHDVLGPVVTALEEALRPGGDRAEEPLRVVLVPCGRLGIVPWHAARGPGGTSPAYLCRTTVFSYAASGSQFLRTVRRAPRDPAAAPVLLADPTLDLTYAEVEVLALRNAFYPTARLCGRMFEVPEGELLPGTPDEVLGFLADGASLLHVASHGSAGVRPTVSALHLAAEPEGDPPTAADGAQPGDLTVTRLLDQPVRQQEGPDGPLVVLSACRTDLSTRDHDEALTLTTAFVSGGARDVVGSRWAADDGTAALLMAVFHHYLNAEGLSPVDALRAAQLWMLDPGREDPGSLSGELLRQAERTDLDRVPLWAAFIHQGHPGPAGTRKTHEGGGPDEHEW